MTPEMREEILTSQRLARIESTLSRICFELDLVINGMRHLLVAQGSRSMADQLGEQLDQIHSERDEARERDTLVPPEPQ